MLAMSGQPIEMLGAVMDGMKAPEETNLVLQSMAPIDEKITQENYFDGLEPPGLRVNSRSERTGDRMIKPAPTKAQHGEDAAAPKKILAEEKGEIGPPTWPEKWLAFRWEHSFQRPEEGHQKEKA
jgi:hypothetical protein